MKFICRSGRVSPASSIQPLVATRWTASLDTLLMLQLAPRIPSLRSSSKRLCGKGRIWIPALISISLSLSLFSHLNLLGSPPHSLFLLFSPKKKHWRQRVHPLHKHHNTNSTVGRAIGPLRGGTAAAAAATALSLVSLHNTDYNPEIYPTNEQQFTLAWALKSQRPSVPPLSCFPSNSFFSAHWF